MDAGLVRSEHAVCPNCELPAAYERELVDSLGPKCALSPIVVPLGDAVHNAIAGAREA